MNVNDIILTGISKARVVSGTFVRASIRLCWCLIETDKQERSTKQEFFE